MKGGRLFKFKKVNMPPKKSKPGKASGKGKKDKKSEKGSKKSKKDKTNKKDAKKGKGKKIPEIPPEKVVGEWMDELWSNVDRTILKNYWDKEMINFIIHCTHSALIKVLNVEFHQHNFYPNFKEKDEPPQSSPADSWAINQMAILPKITEDDELVTFVVSRSSSEDEDEDDVSDIEPERKDEELEPLVDETLKTAKSSTDSTFSNIVNGRIREIEHCVFEKTPIKVPSLKQKATTSQFASVKQSKSDYSKYSRKSSLKLPKTDQMEPVRIMAKCTIRRQSTSSKSLAQDENANRARKK